MTSTADVRTLPTALGSLAIGLLVPPIGLLGLFLCYQARNEARAGHVERAQELVSNAASLTRITLYGYLAVTALIGVAIFFVTRH